jgi:hypothetical protein
MIDIRLFKNRLFAATNAVQIVGQGGLMGPLSCPFSSRLRWAPPSVRPHHFPRPSASSP